MKQTLANALLWLLAKLWPLEDIIGHAVKMVARSKVAAEVNATCARLDHAFQDEMAAAAQKHQAMVDAHQARLQAVTDMPHVVTPEGAAALVAAAATAATVIPQGDAPAAIPQVTAQAA